MWTPSQGLAGPNVQVSTRAGQLQEMPAPLRLRMDQKTPEAVAEHYEAVADHDAVIGCLREASFSIPMAAHAYSVLDSYIYGFALQQASLPFKTSEEAAEMAVSFLRHFSAGAYPH